jgi:hypothetical protein
MSNLATGVCLIAMMYFLFAYPVAFFVTVAIFVLLIFINEKMTSGRLA